MRLREIRNKRRDTLVQLASHMGVTSRAITAWEAGSREPRVKDLIRLADYFGVTLDYLLERVPNVDEYTENEEQLVRKFAELPKEKQEDVLRYLDFVKTK